MTEAYDSIELDLDDYDKLRPEQKVFIVYYINSLGDRVKSAKLAGVTYRATSNWWKEEYFMNVLEECKQVWTETIERSARYSAITDSDAMKKFLLEAENPNKYDARIRAQQHALNHMDTQDNKLEVILVDATPDADPALAEDTD